MGHGFFTTVFMQPLYNGLIFLMSIAPWADAGFVIIVFTIPVRLALYPLSKRSIETQLKMRQAEGDIARIKSTFTDKAQQAAKIMEFYKTKGLNPLSGFVLVVIQIPIIFALYRIFLHSGLPLIDTTLLYSFVHAPQTVSMHFLGLLDLSAKSYTLAFITAVSQFFQVRFSMPAAKPQGASDTFKDNLARSMNVQMRYLFPIMAFFIVYNLSSTIALYWTTNNLCALAQEWYIRRKFPKT
jgi:YidC/Oxa1 family membrane protein insertase